MFGKIITAAAAAALTIAAPAMAQERGTIEFGAFASHSSWDSELLMDDGWGVGGRIGAFLFPRLSIEFDLARRSADRPNGLQSVDVEAFAARLTAVPLILGPVSVLVGAGASHTDWQTDVSDGFQGLLGMKFGFGESADLRVDGIMDWNGDGIRNQTLQVGLSLYRHPETRTVTNTVTVPGPPVEREDSVSAAETRRLRAAEASLRALRDSIAAAGNDEVDPTSAGDLATMSERINFAHDQSELSDSAQAILRDKVSVFRDNPEMRIVITGYASEPGTDAYNMALGLRRAEAAKAFLVSQGVAASRIEIATRGSELLVEGPSDAANAANRRGEFRVQISEVRRPPGG